MNGQTLDNLCRSDAILEQQFRGIYSADNLPHRVEIYPSAYIVNTAFSSDSGEHWLALYFTSSKHSFVFDSIGRRETLPAMIRAFINRNSIQCTYNSSQIQNNRSQTCGLYSLLFLLVASRNYHNAAQFKDLFCSDTLQNDCYVYQTLCFLFE